jgi:hypothetical protein
MVPGAGRGRARAWRRRRDPRPRPQPHAGPDRLPRALGLHPRRGVALCVHPHARARRLAAAADGARRGPASPRGPRADGGAAACRSDSAPLRVRERHRRGCLSRQSQWAPSRRRRRFAMRAARCWR